MFYVRSAKFSNALPFQTSVTSVMRSDHLIVPDMYNSCFSIFLLLFMCIFLKDVMLSFLVRIKYDQSWN